MQQITVHLGTVQTYEQGVSIAADVTDFDIKQIAAQSNGYVVITFPLPDGTQSERKLSLSIQMAQRIIDTQVIPIRYLESSWQPIVMIPIYELQKSTSIFNAIIALIGFIITFTAAIFASKYIRNSKPEDSDIQIELV
tara:strand:- start:22464 stop:22877 length:414 start_codon:yes stop_codon:yes gene_type:complete